MGQTIGVLATRQVAVGVVEDNALTGPIRVYPEGVEDPDALRTMTGDEIAELIGQQVLISANGRQIDSVGVGFPGVIRSGVVEESPNLQQIKGFPFAAALCGVLGRGGLHASVLILNDADAIAAGVAATRGHLEKLIRIWYLGDGVATWWSLSIPRNIFATVAAWGTSKASWGIAPCACAFSTWSRRRYSRRRMKATRDASPS